MKVIFLSNILFILLQIWAFKLQGARADGSCSTDYCVLCDSNNFNCVQCLQNFTLNSQSQICVSNCLQGTYLDPTINKCVTICNSGAAYDEDHRTCKETEKCHKLSSPNGLVFKYNKVAQIHKNFIVISGSQDNKNNESTLSLYSYDPNNDQSLSHLGYLSQSGGSIICFHIAVNILNQDIIYSVSRNQIVQFELNSGIQLNSYNLGKDLFVDSNVYYIDDNYLTIFYLKNQQFSILSYQKQLNKECDDPNAAQCFILFDKVHNNAISGFILDSTDNIISYGPDGMIVKWKISDKSYKIILQNEIYEISNLCLTYLQNSLAIYTFSSQQDDKNAIYIQIDSDTKTYQPGHTSSIIEIIDYNSINKSNVAIQLNEVVLITRSSDKLIVISISVSQQQVTTQILFQIDFTPIITKVFYGQFYLSVQSNGLFYLSRSIINPSQFSLQAIKEIPLSSFQFINDIDIFEQTAETTQYVFLLVGSQLKIITSVSSSQADPYYQVESQVSPSYQRHNMAVNGVWYDETLRLYLTYSQDGSFGVWDTFKYYLFKNKPLYYVLPPWCTLNQNCPTSVQKAILVKTGIFICLYSNSKIISWNFSRISYSVRQTYILKNNLDKIQTFKWFGDRYLYICNTGEIRIYDFNNSETNIINGVYQYIQDYLAKIELANDNNILYLLELARNPSGQWILRLRYTGSYSQANQYNLPREAIDLEYHDSFKKVFVNVKQDYIYAFFFPSIQRVNLYTVGNTNNWLYTFCYSWQQNTLLTINTNGQMVQWKFGTNNDYYVLVVSGFPIPRNNYQLLEKNQIVSTNQGFIMYQNSQSEFIDNQVIGMMYDYLKPCFVYPFKDEITGITITTNDRLFVQFSNGNIFVTPFSCQNPNYGVGSANTTQIVHSQFLRKSYLFQKQQAIQDDANFYLITYSRESNSNLYKFSQLHNTWVQFKNGHTYSVSHAFLDLDNDVLITFSDDQRDLSLILWQYSSMALINQFKDIKNYQISNQSVTVVNIIHYKKSTIILALLSDGTLFKFDYQQKLAILFKLDAGAINYWLDEQTTTLFVLISPFQLQIRALDDFKLITQFIYSQSINTPQDIMVSNNYLFVFLQSGVSIISRSAYKEVQQIVCTQSCKNACYSEKLDQLFLYSSYESDSINVYEASSGIFLYSIYGLSDLNKGQISSVIIDDDDYLLFIGKLNNFITVFFNYYTKQEVGYFYDSIVQYKYSKYISELNTFLVAQFYNFEAISLQEIITSTFKFQDFYIIKWIDYFINSQNEIYYVDGSNIVRKYNQDSQQITIMTKLPNYREIQYYKSFVYMILLDKFIKLKDDLSQIDGIAPVPINGYNILGVYIDFIFIQTFQFQILKLSITDLKQNFSIQNTQLIQLYAFVVEKEELVYITESKAFFIYNYRTNTLVSSFPESYAYYTFVYDLKSKFIIFCSNYKIDFYPYLKNSPGLVTTKTVSLDFTAPIDYFWIDFDYLKLYIVYKQDRKIDIYQMTVVYTADSVSIQFIYYIPNSPSSQSVQLAIQGDFLRVMLPWSIYYYRRDNHQFYRRIQDQSFTQSIRKFVTDPAYPEIVFLPQRSFLVIASQDQTTLNIKVLIKLNLDYPEIVRISISKTTSYQINLLILTQGDIMNYSFNLDINGTKLTSTSQSQCQLVINNPSIGFQVENSLLELKNYFQATGNIQNQPNVVIYGAQFLYYSEIMDQLKALVVYSGDSKNSQLALNDLSFKKNQLKSINIKDTSIVINEKSEMITFHPDTKQLKLFNVVMSQLDDSISTKASIQINNLESASLQYVQIQDLYIEQNTIFMNFDSCNDVTLANIIIKDVKMLTNSTLFNFSSVKNIYIFNLTISNVNIISSDIKVTDALTNSLVIFNKVSKYSIINSYFSQIISNTRSTLFLMKQNLQSILSGVKADNLQQVQFARVQNFGESTELTFIEKEDTFLIDNSQFRNYLSSTDSFILYQGSQLTLNNTIFQSANCQTCIGSVIQIQSTNAILINGTTFQDNIGYNGGSVAVFNSLSDQIFIKGSKFLKNIANFSGGALYLYNSNIQISQTDFYYNQAYIGGAIRYQQYQADIFKFKQFKQNQVSFLQNTAFIHSQNWGSYPNSVRANKITSQKVRNLDEREINESRMISSTNQFTLANIQSGGFLDLSFQILDEEENQVSFDPANCSNNQYSQELCKELVQIKIVLKAQDDNKIRVLGSYISKFLEFISNKQRFEINGVQLVGTPSTKQIILINVMGIITFSNSIQTTEQYNLPVEVQFRECVSGEVYKKSNNMFECYPCPDGSYFISKPNIDEIQQCQRCPPNAKSCQKNLMELEMGYWKSSNSSDNIYLCTEFSNCQGNETTSYCSYGHRGPLCQYCDEDGSIWQSQFQSTGSNKCTKCSGQSQTESFGLALLICLALLSYCIFNIFTMMASSEKITQAYYLRKMKLICISNSCYKKIQMNMSIKALTNFIQMLKIMQARNLQIPVSVSFIPDLFGSPSSSFVFSASCSLLNFQTDFFQPLFVKLITVAASPFVYIISLTIIYLFINPILKGFTFSKSKIVSILVFVFWFLKPNIVSTLIQAISCQEFDGKKYIQLDYTYECYSEIHTKFLLYLLIPSLIFYVILMPGFILLKITKNKDTLDNALVRQRYGYIYQDYRKIGYYWEYMRFMLQLLIILIQNLEMISQNSRSLLMMGLLMIYFTMLTQIKPFMILKYQKIDEQSTVVLIFISILNLAQNNNDGSQQNNVFDIILFIPYYANIFYLSSQIASVSLIPQITNCLQNYCIFYFYKGKRENLLTLKKRNEANKQRALELWKQTYYKLFINRLYQSKKIDQINELVQNTEKFRVQKDDGIQSSSLKKTQLQQRLSNLKSKFGVTCQDSYNQQSVRLSEYLQSQESCILKQCSNDKQPQETIENVLFTKNYPLLDSLNETEIENKNIPYAQPQAKNKQNL